MTALSDQVLWLWAHALDEPETARRQYAQAMATAKVPLKRGLRSVQRQHALESQGLGAMRAACWQGQREVIVIAD